MGEESTCNAGDMGSIPGLGRLPAAATDKSLQLCSTLCDPIDGSPPGSTLPGILQARTLEWTAIELKLVESINVQLLIWRAHHET